MAEVNYLSRQQREELLQQAQLPLVIPADHALALKANLSIPWQSLEYFEGIAKCKAIDL